MLAAEWSLPMVLAWVIYRNPAKMPDPQSLLPLFEPYRRESRDWVRERVGVLANGAIQFEHCPNNLAGAIRQRHPMLAPSFHPFRRNRPNRCRNIDLAPLGASDLA
jgi:hypothetical protein